MRKDRAVKILAQALYNICENKNKSELDQILKNLSAYLSEKRLWSQLPKLISEIKDLDQAKNNIVPLIIVSRHALSETDHKYLLDLASNLSGKKMVTSPAIDQHILGGVILKWQDKILDLSLRKQLNNLSKQLIS